MENTVLQLENSKLVEIKNAFEFNERLLGDHDCRRKVGGSP